MILLGWGGGGDMVGILEDGGSDGWSMYKYKYIELRGQINSPQYNIKCLLFETYLVSPIIIAACG